MRRDRVPSILSGRSAARGGGDIIEGAQRFRGQGQLSSGNIFREVRAGGGAGDQQNIWRSLEQPGEGDLHRRRLKRSRDLVQLLRLQRRKTAQREKGHLGDVLGGQRIHQRVVGAMGNVIKVLHADDGRHFLRIRDLLCRHVAEADMAD